MEFQNICNEMVAPFFLRHPVHLQTAVKSVVSHYSSSVDSVP